MSTASTQLEAIHSMLSAGHRSIRMPRHSLILWGIAGCVLCLATEHVITPTRFPAHWVRALALLLFLALVLSGVALADYQYTRYRISARDESLPFAQAQVTKVWWLLVSMGILFTFATAFFGGGYMVYVIWLVLFGLGIYVHGLFSEQILEWVGVLMILLGIGALALSVAFPTTQWLAASAFGLGMPLLSTMLDRGKYKSVRIRVSQSALWLAVVLSPPLLADQLRRSLDAPDAPAMSLESFQRLEELRSPAVIVIPPGSRVPLKVRVGGGLVENGGETILPLVLAKPLEIALVDGKPDGRFRVAGGQWKQRRFDMWIEQVQFGGTLTPSAGPAASLNLALTVGH